MRGDGFHRLLHERAELGAELAREREHHDVELAQAFRRHAIAMEKDRKRLAEDAGHLVERQTSHLKRTIERAMSDLDSVNAKWLPVGRRLISDDDVARLQSARQGLAAGLARARDRTPGAPSA